jgi:choline dehydrogenase-like flavoprotein
MPEAIVIGSGAAGSVAAWELARHGWDVTVLERGRNHRSGFGEVTSSDLGTEYGSDELKTQRLFAMPDPTLEPYTTRSQEEAADGVARSAQGALGQLGSAVGGTALHYNAKFPRFWHQDFTTLSDLGPQEGAQVADWPIGYDDLAPHYDEIERIIGVQGDVASMPARTLEQAPRSGPFVMPPNPTGYAARLIGDAAAELGFTAYPYPAAVNSEAFDGRPACNSCGLCSSFGCPINARGDSLVSFLNPAVLTGRVRVIERVWVHRIETTPDGGRATGVTFRRFDGTDETLPAEHVLVAASPINTARLLLLSASEAHPTGLGNRSDQVGRNMMFHNFTLAGAAFTHDIEPLRAQSTTLEIDDFVGPVTGPAAEAFGVPWIKGGIVQVGSALPPLMEADLLLGVTGWGATHKALMRFGLFHQRIAGSQLIHEDLPQADNRVDLDPGVTDFLGLPSARITYSPHRHEQAAALHYGPQLEAVHAAVDGSVGAGIIPYPLVGGITYTAHLAGTARMGTDPETSVTDPDGRLHEVDNVWIVDGSTFPTFPGFNPTLTIMANALRITRRLAGAEPGREQRGDGARPPEAADDGARSRRPDAGSGTEHRAVLPVTGGGSANRGALPLLAAGAALAATAPRGAEPRPAADVPTDDDRDLR